MTAAITAISIMNALQPILNRFHKENTNGDNGDVQVTLLWCKMRLIIILDKGMITHRYNG